MQSAHFLCLARQTQKGGAWMLYWHDPNTGQEDHLAFRSKDAASAWARQFSGRKAMRWQQPNANHAYFTWEGHIA